MSGPEGTTPSPTITSKRQFRKFAFAIALFGVIIQLALSVYYLDVGHAPHPHDVPVGIIGSAQQRQPIVDQVNKQGGFDITVYDSTTALTEAVDKRKSYGGLDVSGATPHLYVATAAGPTASTFMKTAFTTAIQERVNEQIAQLSAAGKPVPIPTLQALTTPAPVTDLVALPDNDKYGSSLSFLVQALALGGTIASAGLGTLIPRTRRSVKRGIGHLATLIVYAAGSAAAVLGSMKLFDIGVGANRAALFATFFLVSLAITASIAGFVALIGQAGMAAGLIYFGVGTVISGASIPSEFLPTAARIIGQALPTGAGAHAVRDSLYFPAASISGPLLILAAYAVIGCAVVLFTNIRGSRGSSEIEEVVHHGKHEGPATA